MGQKMTGLRISYAVRGERGISVVLSCSEPIIKYIKYIYNAKLIIYSEKEYINQISPLIHLSLEYIYIDKIPYHIENITVQ